MPLDNIFESPQELKKWAIALANQCGGGKVIETKILVKANPIMANLLLNKFAVQYNEQVLKAEQEQAKDTVVFQGKEIELEEEE